MKKLFFIVCFAAAVSVLKAEAFRTQSFLNNIKTVRAQVAGFPLAEPVISLSGDERIKISFDELSYETHSYNYQIVHCNADWTPSALAEIEYLQGYNSGFFPDGEQSRNTATLYTHYALELPNDDVQLLLSGNYVVKIFEDGQTENVLATACFSVVEEKMEIVAAVKGNTDVELYGAYQQLEFTLLHPGLQIRDPFSELKIFVRQNNRLDNEVANLRPTFTEQYKQTFRNNRALIFEGGNEYRTVDFSSEYTYGGGIDRFGFDGETLHVKLENDRPRANEAYASDRDVDEKQIIHRQHSASPETEADYVWVHFSLPASSPFLDGDVHLSGAITAASPTLEKMVYNPKTACYEKAILLKQGGASYLYLLETAGSLSAIPIEGSHWQTQNSYQILVYYRPLGARYDRLIGWQIVGR